LSDGERKVIDGQAAKNAIRDRGGIDICSAVEARCSQEGRERTQGA
jgi:hypothetical protein